jgi:hypothetical protein
MRNAEARNGLGELGNRGDGATNSGVLCMPCGSLVNERLATQGCEVQVAGEAPKAAKAQVAREEPCEDG